MTLNQLINICIEILTNWYIIGTILVMVFIICFSNFVLHYKKKPKTKKKKTVAAAEKPKKAAPAEPKDDDKEENGELENN